MRAFGAKTQKKTWLYSGHRFIDEIDDFWTHPDDPGELSLVNKYINAEGETKCAGNIHLKSSQAYPWGFGEALAKLWRRHADTLRSTASSMLAETAHTLFDVSQLDGDDDWPMSELGIVLKALIAP